MAFGTPNIGSDSLRRRSDSNTPRKGAAIVFFCHPNFSEIYCNYGNTYMA